MRIVGLARLLAVFCVAVGLVALLQLRVGERIEEPTLPTSPPLTTSSRTIEAAGGALGIERVSNAEEAVRTALRDRYGITCYDSSDVTYAVPRDFGDKLDQLIEQANLKSEGWIAKGMWLGTSAGAAQAFGAAEVYSDAAETWMLIATDKGPQGVQLRSWVSKGGKVAWTILNHVGRCASADPAYDEQASPYFSSR